MKIDPTNLERALANSGKPKNKKTEQMPQMNREQEIAFHQGCLNTLVNERNELIKMIGNVEMVMQAHLKRLEELGVKMQSPEKK